MSGNGDAVAMGLAGKVVNPVEETINIAAEPIIKIMGMKKRLIF